MLSRGSGAVRWGVPVCRLISRLFEDLKLQLLGGAPHVHQQYGMPVLDLEVRPELVTSVSVKARKCYRLRARKWSSWMPGIMWTRPRTT